MSEVVTDCRAGSGLNPRRDTGIELPPQLWTASLQIFARERNFCLKSLLFIFCFSEVNLIQLIVLSTAIKITEQALNLR
jgi:hypothetical protein